MKKILKLSIFLFILICACANANKIVVTTASQFKSAITNLNPGDTLEVANGTYDLNSYVNITKSGTAELPIVIKAQSIGGAILINKSLFDLKQVSYVTIEGFDIRSKDGTVFKLESCKYIRITRNYFRVQETTSQKWIIVGGTYNMADSTSGFNRIDHNYFENKTQPGNFITMDGTPNPTSIPSQYDRIDHNYFKNSSPRVTNEKESIRLGQSELSGKSGYTVVEYNLFEDCDGDPEVVSVKTCDDTIRYNTFLHSQGTLCLRQGKNSWAYGNYFIGNDRDSTGGIRAYSSGHKIFNNYFENLGGEKWDAAITITNGDAENTSTSYSSHYRPENIFIGFNTIVNCKQSFEIGFTNNGAFSKSPRYITFANNLINGDKNELVKIYTQPSSSTWSGNIMYPTGSATMGISLSQNEINQVDPLLISQNNLMKLSSGSPAINAATGSYSFLTDDMDGQMRDITPDIGADEYSNSPIIRKPLTPEDVGPNASDLTTAVVTDKISVPLYYELKQNYPNPFNPSTIISYSMPVTGLVTIKVYDLIGREIVTLVNELKSAGNYKIKFDAANLSSGVYFYKIQAGKFISIKKMILTK